MSVSESISRRLEPLHTPGVRFPFRRSKLARAEVQAAPAVVACAARVRVDVDASQERLGRVLGLRSKNVFDGILYELYMSALEVKTRVLHTVQGWIHGPSVTPASFVAAIGVQHGILL